MAWKAEYVLLDNGKTPFIEFLDNLSIDEKIDITAAIDELIEWKNNNWIIPQSKSKYLRNKIYEMRVRHKNVITRSFYFFYHVEKIVFTHGFVKKTSKIPNSEIEKAEKLRNYFVERNRE